MNFDSKVSKCCELKFALKFECSLEYIHHHVLRHLVWIFPTSNTSVHECYVTHCPNSLTAESGMWGGGGGGDGDS